MAPDLHIHIATDDALTDIGQHLQSDATHSQLGRVRTEFLIDNIWVRLSDMTDDQWGRVSDQRSIPLAYDIDRVYQTPNCWIGALMYDGPARNIQELIGTGLVMLKPELITQIMATFDQPNPSGMRLANPQQVKRFLDKHCGRSVFALAM